VLRALLRIVLAVSGAVSASALVALMEARAVAVALVEGGAPVAPPTGSTLVTDLSVLAPVAMLIGGGVAVATLVFEPAEPRSPLEYLAELREGPVIDRLRAAAMSPLVVLAVFGWAVGSAHLGRSALAVGRPADAGLSVGIGSVLLLLGSVGVATSLLPLTRRVLAMGSGSVPRLLDPLLTGGIAFGLCALLFLVGILTGDTGGEGGTLAVFGVLKRAELDLRPVANAGLLAAFAYASPILFTRGKILDPNGRPRPPVLAAAAAGTLLVLVVSGLCARAASAMDEEPLVTRGVEKYAPLGKISLALLRRTSDHDKDGYSARFGGGDCNDKDPLINPGALDVPGNGIDEDCSGADTPAPSTPIPDPVAAKAAKPRHKPRNLILFTVDTLRTDLGFMGYNRPVSPNLDELAAKSTVFERAYSMASYTGKSVGPMLIGKYPSETARDGGHFNTYFPQNTFVTERVHDTGRFRTFAAHCHWYFRFPTGMNQGFDVWDYSAIPPGMGDNDTSVTSSRMSEVALKLLARPENTSPGTATGDGDGGVSGATTVDGGEADAGVDAGAGDGGVVAVVPPPTDGSGRRFFAWFHFFDPHAQYVPHEGAPAFDGPYQAKNLYDQEVWYTDKHIGKVLDYVKSQPWGDDTAIVLTADHGEAFSDHGMSWHGMEIWESLVRVPLVVYIPGEKPRRVPVKRSHIDVAPTLLEIMGGPPAAEGELSGESLLADVYLPEGEEHAERDVLVDMPAGPYNGVRRAIITGPTPGMKLIHSGGSTYGLFDLAADPNERKDLSSDKEKLQPVLARLQAMRARLHEIEVKPSPP